MLKIQKQLEFLRNHDEFIARWISHIISPHYAIIFLASGTTLWFSDNPWLIVQWLLLVIPLIAGPPILYILWLVRNGSLVDFYMPRREERLRPLTASMLWFLICLLLIHYWQAPIIIETFLISTLALVAVLSMVTIFWKISFHGATVTAVATTLLAMAGSQAWPVMLLVPLVGWSRVRLARHTFQQVLMGSIIGALLALTLAYTLLFRVI